MVDESEKHLVDLIMERLDQHRQWTHPQPPQPTNTGLSGTTFTIPQILSVLFAFVTIGGTLFAAWNGLTNKIETQKVSSDLIIEQMHKDIEKLMDDNKEQRAHIDAQILQIQSGVKDVSNRVDELDSTVNQLYSKTIAPQR